MPKNTLTPYGEEVPRGWHSRGYLPHFEGGEIPQTITFRLFDSLPRSLVKKWREELSHLPENEAEAQQRIRIEAFLDRGEGAAWMNDPRVADMVQQGLLFFDGDRYGLHSWVVMPNHVHALFTPRGPWELSDVLHSWKSFTSKECNKILRRRGVFWQKENFDRYVRDDRHYENAVAYIENNPVKAGLCQKPEDWPWGSARWRKKR